MHINIKGWKWGGEGDVPVVVSTTSETATSRVLAVLAYTTVTGGDVSSVLASLGQMSRHLSQKSKKEVKVSIRNSIPKI